MASPRESATVLKQQLRLVGAVTERINRGTNLGGVLAFLIEQLREIIPCNRIAIGFLQADGHTLVLGPVQSDGKIVLRSGYQESIQSSSLRPLIETGETRIINDLDAHLKRKPDSKSTRLIVKEGLKSSLTVPLVVSDRRVGVMWLSSRERGVYEPQHEAFMGMIAGHLAIIVEKGRLMSQLEEDNAKLAEAHKLKTRFAERLEEEVRKQTARNTILLRIARAIHSTLDLGHVFQELVNALTGTLTFERASILLLSDDGRVLRFGELEPKEREHLGRDMEIPLKGSAAGRAIAEERPLYTPDLGERTSFYEDVYLLRAGIRSRVAVPLFVQKRPIGTFNLASEQPNAFSEDDIEFLARLADQISVAVANSDAYEQIERQKDRLHAENIQLREVISRSPELKDLVGESPAWRRVLEQVEIVAEANATVLILGETGTGKEVVARALHKLSSRRDAPFIAVNCAALSPELIASELFGHEKGAFTGAFQKRLGRMELAQGGTLFLDEIVELPTDLQAKLLRAIQEREFERLGGTKTIHADFRILAATNRDLSRARAEGKFRDDLFFRLNVFPIHIPPLRERKEDIEPLLMYFLRRHSQKVHKVFTGIRPLALQKCMAYAWPGNVREVENLVERAVILCPEPILDLDPSVLTVPSSMGPQRFATLDDTIRSHIIRALEITHGKIYGEDGAARWLGLKPSTLQMKLKKLGIDRRAVISRSEDRG